MFKMKNENGKKNLENLSIYIAVAWPWQNVSYCGSIIDSRWCYKKTKKKKSEKLTLLQNPVK